MEFRLKIKLSFPSIGLGIKKVSDLFDALPKEASSQEPSIFCWRFTNRQWYKEPLEGILIEGEA
jgi:hypothetical protein